MPAGIDSPNHDRHQLEGLLPATGHNIIIYNRKYCVQAVVTATVCEQQALTVVQACSCLQ